MRKSKKAALIIIMSSVYLAGCNAAGGRAAADPSTAASKEVTEPGAETISPEILEALESKTVDVKGYYIDTINRNGGNEEREHTEEYKGYLNDIEIIEISGEIITAKAYLIDRDEFFTTADKVEIVYNIEDGNVEIKTDKMKIEPTVFFDTSMFFDNEIYSAYAVYNNRWIEGLPEMSEGNIKDITLLYAVDDKKTHFNDFFFDGYVNIIDKEDNLYLCEILLYYIPHSGIGITREKMEKDQWTIWAVKIVGVEKIE